MTRSPAERRGVPAIGITAACALLCLAAAVLGRPAACPGQEMQPEKVVVGEIPILPSIGTFIALEKGYFEEMGLEVELRMHKSPPQVIPLLATGRLDVGGGGINAGLFNALAGGAELVIVADKGHHPWDDSAPAAHGIAISARLHPGRLSRESLMGKAFAVPGRGSPQEIYLERFLGRFGLGLGDVEVLGMPVTSMLPALAEGTLFGAALLEPFLTIALEKGMAVSAATGGDLYPGQQAGVVMFSRDFVTRRRETAVKYLAAYLKGVRTFNDYLSGKVGDEEIFAIAEKHTSLKDPALFARMGKPSLDPSGRLNVESMESDMRWLHEHGFVDRMPELSRFIDSSVAADALRALGGDVPP